MEKKLFVPIILGTPREGRLSEFAANWLYQHISSQEDIETKLIDVRDFSFPVDNYGGALKETFKEYTETIIRSDGLIIISPEYNHGYSGTLKTLLDVLLKEYFHKSVGLVGVSRGVLGGARAVENLIPVARELGLVPIFKSLNMIQAGGLFDEKGKLLDEAYSKRADEFLEELIWMTRTLKWGRENIPTQFRKLT